MNSFQQHSSYNSSSRGSNNSNSSNHFHHHQHHNNSHHFHHQQISTQFTGNQQPVTFLSILNEGKIQLGEVSNSWGQNGDWVLRALVMSINQLLSINDQYPNNHSQFLPEHMKLPMITIEGYIARIIKYSPCSKECFIIILMYIDRLIQKRNFIVNSYNIHRILITCVLVAAKYLDDIFYNNQFYSQVGGVSVKEINTMEIDLLKLLSFDVSARVNEYTVYFEHFKSYCEKLQLTLNFQPNTKGLPEPIPLELHMTTTSNKNNNLSPNNKEKEKEKDKETNTNSNISNNNLIISSNNNKSNVNNNNPNDNNNSVNNNTTNNSDNSNDDKIKNNNTNNNNNNNNQYHHPLPFRFPPVQPNMVA
ncbi:hypothetical protein DICPUDRAFT_93345 [Dictyostelium purpureum]|uniref:Cyclin-like domain-containing protein n=1 Tax=Dictyostelium purpureum TaxID=5786 RepID=F1A636_DICPU|nr:uncharacterized protein DICPUDRAFT_93345 [Dictyostelium purpureum]EGC28342.1 hypothetical protein DICPUDRAFT_93345 [Dictyostelium purpureum]|eukprot:XP_003295130.1 hypothetical protein DICPUDRAFT_93345 [Dictyostelium purpureum]